MALTPECVLSTVGYIQEPILIMVLLIDLTHAGAEKKLDLLDNRPHIPRGQFHEQTQAKPAITLY